MSTEFPPPTIQPMPAQKASTSHVGAKIAAGVLGVMLLISITAAAGGKTPQGTSTAVHSDSTEVVESTTTTVRPTTTTVESTTTTVRPTTTTAVSTTIPKPATAPASTTPATAPAPASAPAPAATWTLVKVIDGDTIDVTRDGVTERIRLIGIDTPERGQCGYAEAADTLRAFIGSQPITLTIGARDDRDKYDRLLRYIDTPKGDANLWQIMVGQAIARYDSRDGYGRHTRETQYVSTDATSPAFTCAAPAPVVTAPAHTVPAAPVPVVPAPVVPAPVVPAPAAPAGVYYANCAAVRAAGAAPLYAGQPGYETPRLDRDGDGVACEG